jgi:hypothetical protein
MGHMGYIYFVAQRDAVKIGFSVYPDKRIGNIQTANSEPLEVLGYYRGEQEEEKRLHVQFAHLKIKGEWFRATPELMSLVKAKIKTNGQHEELWTTRELRKIRDAHRHDKITVSICNLIISQIKNLLKAKETGDEDVARNLRKFLMSSTEGLMKRLQT